ncbi:MAG: hypothetical protein ABFS12_08620 [Bacteroidota bacterium]
MKKITENIIKKKYQSNVSVWLLFTAAFIIVVFFLWYFLFYVNNNENSLIQKNFRVLTQIGENFKSRYNSFHKVVISKDIKNYLYNLDTNKNFKHKKNNIKKYFFGIEIVDTTEEYDNNYLYISELNGNIKDSIKCRIDSPKQNSDKIIDLDHVNFRISKNEFFNPLERREVFEKFIVIKKDQNNITLNEKHQLFYTSFPGSFNLTDFDSLTNDKGKLNSGIIRDILIGGIDYKLFLTQIILKNNDSYCIGGIINNDDYVSNIRSINPYLALLVLIIFILFMLSIPLIKLKMISINQQLSISDLLLSTVSIISGAFLIMLILFSLISSKEIQDDIDKNLKTFSDTISVNFINEVNKISYTLDLFKNDPDFIIVSKRLTDTNYIALNESKHIRLDESTYNYFKLIFRLNKNGDQDSIISSRKKQSSPDNYSYRKYFQESGEWKLDSNNLMLDFIVSSTSGEQLGVISKRENETVFVLTSRLNSVVETISQSGYGFCVIDKKGDVKLHSDSKRMLQENFLEETEYTTDINSALYGNTANHFSANYYGKNYSCYIQPIKDIPLYLITFFDDSYKNYLNLQTTSETFLFLSFSFFLFFLLVIGARLISYKKSELKRSFDAIDWLRPNNSKMELYKRMCQTNCISILFIFLSWYLMDAAMTIFLIYIYLVMQIAVANYYTHHLVKKSFSIEYIFSLVVLPFLVLAILFYYVIKAEVAIGPLLFFVFLLILVDYLVINHNLLNFFQSSILFSKVKKHLHFYSYLLVWLFLIIVIPVSIFYTIFFNFEAKLKVSHDLYSLAKDKAERDYIIDKFYYEYVDTLFTKNYCEPRKLEGIYHNENIIMPIDSSDFTEDSVNLTNMSLYNMLYDFKYDYDRMSTERKSLVHFIKNDSSKNFVVSNDSIYFRYRAAQVHHSNKHASEYNYYLGIASKFKISKTERIVFSFLTIILIFSLIYKLIEYTANRMFGIVIEKEKDFQHALKQHIESGNNLIVQCLTSCNSSIIEYLRSKEFSVLNYDNSGDMNPDYIDKMKKDKNKILIENFYLSFENINYDLEKLKQIKSLFEEYKEQIVLIGKLSIDKLIENINREIKITTSVHLPKSANGIQNILDSINKSTATLYASINEYTKKDNEALFKDKFDQLPVSEELNNLIKRELIELGLHEKQFENYGNVIKNVIKNEKELKSFYLKDKIILKIQELAKGHYESIWNSCTNEEKLLLNDISDNLLLNDNNKKVIQILIYKGLLKKDISVDIMNQSFRNFINEKADTEEEKEYLEIRKTGTWQNYRAPILMIALALAFFIALQKNILSDLTSILPAIIAALGLVSKVSGIFSKVNTIPN